MNRYHLILDNCSCAPHTHTFTFPPSLAFYVWLNCYKCVAVCILLQVKELYVRNLMLSTAESTIEEVFSLHAPVQKVKKIRDHAFVHFYSKEDAHKAMNELNGEPFAISQFPYIACLQISCDNSQQCIIILVCVRLHGKRYHLGKKFEIVLVLPCK